MKIRILSLLGCLIVTAALGCNLVYFPLSTNEAYAVESPDDEAPAEPADGEDQTTEDEEETGQSYFSNPAQAMHAANLAEQSALQNTDMLQDSIKAVEDAKEELEKAMEDPDNLEAIEMAQKQLEMAEEQYAEKLSEVTGVIEEDILDMRETGMGWGAIAHELGVHPGLLGLGKTKGKQKNWAGSKSITEETIAEMTQPELAEATARDPKSGWSKGHGYGVQSGVKSTGSSSGTLAGISGPGKGNKNGGKNSSSGGGYSGAGGLGSQDSTGNSAGGSNSSTNAGGGVSNKGSKGNKGGNSNNNGKGNSQGNKGGNSSNGNKGGNGKK